MGNENLTTAVENLKPRARSKRSKRVVPNNVVHLKIVPKPISMETAQELYNLWMEAMAGRLHGLAYVAVLKDGYATHTVGEATQRKEAVLGAIVMKLTQ